MRALIQRAKRAEVRVGGNVIGKIGHGAVVLVGFTHSDGDDQVTWMTDKIVGLRIFADEQDKMNRSILESAGELLVVSQFTLYGDADKGRRPSFIDAARPEVAAPLYERFIVALKNKGIPVETGVFGAMMVVDIQNDGPVTLILERNS